MRGYPKHVSIGYGSNKKTKFLLPNGFKKFLIRNENDIELLLMNNRTFCGEIAKNISAVKRRRILKRANELNVKITNPQGKLTVEEGEED